VAVPGSTDPKVVAFLETLGLRPGVHIEVREKHPFDGPIVVGVGGKDRTIGEKVANQIYVRPRGALEQTAERAGVDGAKRKRRQKEQSA
jgi:Fe2+ transport system protein FeoA